MVWYGIVWEDSRIVSVQAASIGYGRTIRAFGERIDACACMYGVGTVRNYMVW